MFGPCKFCEVKVKDVKITGLWGLITHETSVHSEFKWECPSCKNTFAEEQEGAMATCEESLKEHMETYQCDLRVLLLRALP